MSPRAHLAWRSTVPSRRGPFNGTWERGLFGDLQAQFASELERLATLAADSLGIGGEGLMAIEPAIRTAMRKLGGSLLEQLLALDTGHWRSAHRLRVRSPR